MKPEWNQLQLASYEYCNSTVKPLLANNIKLMFHYPKGIVSNYCYNIYQNERSINQSKNQTATMRQNVLARMAALVWFWLINRSFLLIAGIFNLIPGIQFNFDFFNSANSGSIFNSFWIQNQKFAGMKSEIKWCPVIKLILILVLLADCGLRINILIWCIKLNQKLIHLIRIPRLAAS